jgi:predicted protein tyrosine phosphatase
MADNENDSPAKQIAAELLARDGDKALGIAYEQRRRAEKLGDSAAADAWQRIARAIVLIELERLRRMLDETSGVTGSDTYPAATHVTVAADRDEAPKSDGRPSSHAGENAWSAAANASGGQIPPKVVRCAVTTTKDVEWRRRGEPMSTSRTVTRITICGIPELGGHSAAGVTHVLSILDPNSPDPLEFAAFAPHRRLILRFHDVIEPQPDQIAPTREDVERLLVFGREVSETPEANLLIHCRAGVSRSTAAAALILTQANPEWPASMALDAVAAIRPRAWPNLLILEFGDALLGRNGEIAAAAGAIYRRVLARDPEFRHQMIDAGRGREVIAAYRKAD